MTPGRDRVAYGDGAGAERLRLFRNDYMERLTVITPRAFAVIWTAVLALAVYASWGTASVPAAIGLGALGLLIWTLFEYAMHRFIFHWKMRSEWGRRMIFVSHGNHHVTPGDPYRNLMPPIVSLTINGAFWGVFLLLFGAAGSVVFIGYAVGYIAYDSIHYACHQFPMRVPVLRHLRKHHIRHHHAKQDGNYAITAIFWDRVFGTRLSTKRR
jgi:sterol desaturase/sphingolipid hydroxylase (fatty acid hydroxylase superfamily)